MTHAFCVLAGSAFTASVTLDTPGYAITALIFGAAATALHIMNNINDHE